MLRERKHQPTALGDILEKVLVNTPLQKEVNKKKLALQWQKIVGEDVAKISRPLYTKKNILFIGCESPVALEYIRWHEKVIVKKARKFFGKEINVIKCISKEEGIWEHRLK